MTENDRVLDTLARARDWLATNISRCPNRSGTTWRVGFTNVELGYVLGEGTLTLWTDGNKERSVVLRTRGRDPGDLDTWMGALAAVSP
jgi:hypothetical protein